MSAKKSAPKGRKKTTAKSTGRTAVAKVPQPHGGALNAKGTEGNPGGTGRPPSELRQRLVGSFADRINVIEQIADGTPVKRAEVSLAAVLRHAHCPTCGDTLKPNDDTTAADLVMVKLEGMESASPSDRLKAMDLAAKYGLGVKDELTVVSPDVQARLGRQVAVIHRELPRELADRLLDALTAEVWT